MTPATRVLDSYGGTVSTSLQNLHSPFSYFARCPSVCPGRFMAFSAVWLAIASIVYVFDIEKAKDEDGNEIEPLEECISTLVV